MKILALPPRIKVLEALGAIADGRIRVINDRMCKVRSSMGDKEYTVYLDIERGLVYSNDNGTMHRNYIGYPIIAFMMVKRIIPLDEKLAKALSGIEWKVLNERYKKYVIVERMVKSIAKSRGIDEKYIDEYIDRVMKLLSKYRLQKLESLPLR